MPRARGRFEPVDHFVLGHLSILGPLSLPLGRRTPQSGSLVQLSSLEESRIIELRREHLMTSFLGRNLRRSSSGVGPTAAVEGDGPSF